MYARSGLCCGLHLVNQPLAGDGLSASSGDMCLHSPSRQISSLRDKGAGVTLTRFPRRILSHWIVIVSDLFKDRRPGLVGWARAAFEQDALPALLSLSGAVVTRVLPGDSMFQATHIIPGYMRPAVVHGYGGAKVDLPVSLPGLSWDHSWRLTGWHPWLITSMVQKGLR